MSTQFPDMSDLNDLLNDLIALPVGPEKDRIFDLANNPRYETIIKLPHKLTWFDGETQMTFLCYGDNYTPTKSEAKAARNTMRRAGIPPFKLGDPGYPLVDTIIIELASTIENGFVCAVRYFGHGSKYNRWEDEKKILKGLVSCVQRACMQVQQMVETDLKWVKRVIFQTDSDDVLQAVTKIWHWHKDGFPGSLPIGVEEVDYMVLNYHTENLEAANGGMEVLFWKLPSEYLPGAYHQVEVEQSFVHQREMKMPAGGCGHCTVRQQMQEYMFAKTGNPCCPNLELVEKYGHLKKGDTFPLTNPASVDAKVTMEIDGSVAVDAVKQLGQKILQIKDTNVSKAKDRKDCGH